MNKKLLILPLLCCLTGCSGIPTYEDVEFYYGQSKDANGKMEFNHDLFYRNDPKVGGPDPFVFDNTSRDGYYYMLSTVGFYYMGRSKDLMNWEGLGNALPNACCDSTGLMKQVVYSNYWAPEITYDEDTNLYYFFCSAKSTYNNVVYNSNAYVGVSENAGGPYYLVNFLEEDESINFANGTRGAGLEHLHTFDDTLYDTNFAPYLLFEPDKFVAAINQVGLNYVAPGNYARSIDLHPYTDPDNGKKYMYFVNEVPGGCYCIYGMEMEDWLTPKWDTFNGMVIGGYYTLEDALNSAVDTPLYEQGKVNEGPAVFKHNEKYYMTVSNGSYVDSSYCLIQCVADHPLGPWRKLRDEENAVLMSSQLQGNEDVSSSGHNAFVTVDDELYCIYHKHRSYTIGGSDRVAAVDKIKWITIQDIYGNDLDVMYANGPTCTIQPRIEKYSKYKNIARGANVELSKGNIHSESDIKYLNDDLLSTYKGENAVTTDYVKETIITKESTFRFSFDNPQSVRSVMVYNSKNENMIFKEIKNINVEFENNGKIEAVTFNNIPFLKDFYNELEEFNQIIYVTPGSSAFAEFNEIKNVKSVSVTLDVPSNAQLPLVGISEIVILGGK